MSHDVDAKWLAEQAVTAGNALVDRYGWEVPAEGLPDDPDGLTQEDAVRLLASAAWSDGFRAGLKARVP